MRSINGEREVKSIYSLFCATNSLPFVARSAENFFWDIVSSIDSPFWNKKNWSEKTNLKKEITHSYDNDSAKNICFLLICRSTDFTRLSTPSACLAITDDFQSRGFNAKSRRNSYLFCCNIEHWKSHLFCPCVHDSSHGFGTGIRQARPQIILNKENSKLKSKCSANICCKKVTCMFCINTHFKKWGLPDSA